MKQFLLFLTTCINVTEKRRNSRDISSIYRRPRTICLSKPTPFPRFMLLQMTSGLSRDHGGSRFSSKILLSSYDIFESQYSNRIPLEVPKESKPVKSGEKLDSSCYRSRGPIFRYAADVCDRAEAFHGFFLLPIHRSGGRTLNLPRRRASSRLDDRSSLMCKIKVLTRNLASASTW